jgi:hypothetical protein
MQTPLASDIHEEIPLRRIDGGCDTLQRAALSIAPQTTCGHINRLTPICMVRLQSFDISTPEAKLALARATDDARSSMGTFVSDTGVSLRELHTADLLHPFLP